MTILGIDPGREKTGLAVINSDGDILDRTIVAPLSLGAALLAMWKRWKIERIVLGHSTASDAARDQIETALQSCSVEIEVRVVDETGSTLQARDLYWADHPRTGWRRLVPLSLQEPPEPVDDYAAAIVARRAL